MPGKLQNYRMKISWEPRFPVPDTCTVKRTQVVTIGSSSSNYTFQGGEGYSNYTVSIQARTAGGWSPEAEIEFVDQKKGGQCLFEHPRFRFRITIDVIVIL